MKLHMCRFFDKCEVNPMNGLRTLGVVGVVGLSMLAGCAGNDGPRLVWKDGQRSPAQSRAATGPQDRDPPAASDPSPDDIVSISPKLMKELMAFVNAPRILLGDRIEVEASRVPFQIAMVPMVDPSTVAEKDVDSQKQKMKMIILTSRVKIPAVATDYARLRIGDGMDLAAGRRLRARIYNRIDPKRPVYLTIHLLGHAVYVDETTKQRVQRQELTLVAQLVRGPGGLVFQHYVR